MAGAQKGGSSMTETPRISVVTPVFNGARFLEATIKSVLGQGYSDLEYVLVDDGSTDETHKILAQFGGALRVITQENTGHVIARNVGLRATTGSIVSFIDQDDIWPEGRLGAMLPHITSGAYDYVRGKTLLFGDDIAHDVPIYRYAIVGACLYRAEIFASVGLFDEGMDAGEDFDWNVRLGESAFREKRIDEVTLWYRQHDTNLSHTDGFLERGQFDTLRKKLKRART